MEFPDLPVDLLPLILQHIVRPQHLAWVCLVNKDFHSFAIVYLYGRIAIYPWFKGGKIRASNGTFLWISGITLCR